MIQNKTPYSKNNIISSKQTKNLMLQMESIQIIQKIKVIFKKKEINH